MHGPQAALRHFRTFASDAATLRLDPLRTFPEARRRAGSDPGLVINRSRRPGLVRRAEHDNPGGL
jgi:hypothetical protein